MQRSTRSLRFLSRLPGYTRFFAPGGEDAPSPEALAATPQGLVDIHAHILPDMDDGPASMEEALALCRALVAEGVVRVVATPHQSGLYPRNTNAAIRAAVDRLRAALDEHEIPLTVSPGADVRIDADLVRRARDREFMTLADRQGYVLLELPHDVAFPLTNLVRELRGEGLTPILSHPERNLAVARRPTCLWEWLEAGLLFQITMDSLLGAAGKPVQRTARWILDQGLCAMLAGDVHSIDGRPPRHQETWHIVVSRWGAAAARRLMVDLPARIVGGGQEAQKERSVREAARCPVG